MITYEQYLQYDDDIDEFWDKIDNLAIGKAKYKIIRINIMEDDRIDVIRESYSDMYGHTFDELKEYFEPFLPTHNYEKCHTITSVHYHVFENGHDSEIEVSQ